MNIRDIRIDRKWIVPSAVGAVSFGVGAAVGYMVCAKRFKKTLDEISYLAEQMNEFADQVEIKLQDRAEVNLFIHDEQKTLVFEDESEEVVEMSHSHVVSVFPDVEDDTDDWDYEVEVRARELTPNVPYIIHRDEFDDNQDDYSQSTLTYYEGDDVLTDEHDVPIYNPHTIIGPRIEFGKGSGDPNIFYVRNDRLNAEYEVIRDRGFYAMEILGAHMEFEEPEEKNRVLKFREE